MKNDPQNSSLKQPVTRRGFLATSASFASFALAFGNLGTLAAWAQGATKAAKWSTAMELAVTVEMNQPAGGRYNRPYVAVWFEDEDGNPVRTLSLWVNAGRGSRWIPDLRRWFRDERARQAKDGGDLVSTLSSPTRMPGRYSLVWDGKTDKKLLVDQGDYYLCVEAAREHGTYGLIREKLTLGEKGFTKSFEGNTEVRGVTVEYRDRA